MTFVLRIFFSGLIAFVPNANRTELTVLLLNTPHQFQASDGTSVPHHMPVLLARAGGCAGQCPQRDPEIAQFLYADKSPADAASALADALSHGGGWVLSGAELSLRKGCPAEAGLGSALVLQSNVRRSENDHPTAIPATPQEREDFSWVANIKQLNPAHLGFSAAVLAAVPPADLVAARLVLKNGRVTTYRLVQIDGKVKPVHFQPLGGGEEAPDPQAVANWVMAEIQVSGDTVEIAEQAFGGTARRTMTLSPQEGVVELAVLNLPPFEVPTAALQAPPAAGRHFERYFDLMATPPPAEARPVPQPVVRAEGSEPEIEWSVLHPQQEGWSELLEKLRMGLSRGPYDRTLCPLGQGGVP